MPKINVHDGLLIAASKQTDTAKLRTYIYHLNFQCLAGDIEEADDCFIENTKLSFGEKHKPGWMCPNISRTILLPPKEDLEIRLAGGGNRVTEQRLLSNGRRQP